MTQAYKYSILYFLLFSLLLVLSGVLLFDEKIGFSVQGVLDYYLGNEAHFTQKKSFEGIMKTVLPHIFAFGLFSMVLLHFLIFTKEKKLPKLRLLVLLMFSVASFEIFTPLLIINGFEVFAYLKLISFFLFEGCILYTAWLLFMSILYT